jgi:hypothetical protein
MCGTPRLLDALATIEVVETGVAEVGGVLIHAASWRLQFTWERRILCFVGSTGRSGWVGTLLTTYIRNLA